MANKKETKVPDPYCPPLLSYDAMLTEIAAHRINVRPIRNEPRAVRREAKHYPSLKTTRAEWRLTHAA